MIFQFQTEDNNHLTFLSKFKCLDVFVLQKVLSLLSFNLVYFLDQRIWYGNSIWIGTIGLILEVLNLSRAF